MSAVRIDPQTDECPGEFVPCSLETSNENTICYHPDDSREEFCPITFIDFVPFETLGDEDEFLAISEKVVFVYSRDKDSLPIVETLTSDNQPCIDSTNVSPSCKRDPAYRELGTTLTAGTEAALGDKNFYSRRVTAWALKCEADQLTSKEHFLFLTVAETQARFDNYNKERIDYLNPEKVRTTKTKRWFKAFNWYTFSILALTLPFYLIGCQFETKEFNQKEQGDTWFCVWISHPIFRGASTVLAVIEIILIANFLSVDRQAMINELETFNMSFVGCFDYDSAVYFD